MAQSKLEAALMKSGIVDDLQLRSARRHQDQWGGSLTRAVVEKGFAAESAVVEALAQQLGLTRAELGVVRKDAAALAKVPVEYAEQHGVFPIALRDNGKTLVVALADPTDLDVTDHLLRVARCRIKPQIAGDREIANAIRIHYRGLAPEAAGPSARDAGGRADAVAVEGTSGEFEIEDMSGPRIARKPSATSSPSIPVAAPAPPPVPAPPPAAPRAADTANALDELMGERGSSEFSAEDVARLEALLANQEKGSRILDAVIALCREKGFFSSTEADDLSSRRKR